MLVVPLRSPHVSVANQRVSGIASSTVGADSLEPVKGESQERLVDRLVREAMEKGDFDDLPGQGKPIPGAGTVDDDGWWIRDWVKRNVKPGVSTTGEGSV